MTLGQIEHLAPSSVVVDKDEGAHNDEEIGGSEGGMVNTEEVKEKSQTWCGATQAGQADKASDIYFKFGQAGAGFVETP